MAYNVPLIFEVAWYPEGVDKYLRNCIKISKIFIKGNLPKAKAKPQHIFPFPDRPWTIPLKAGGAAPVD